MYEGSPKSTRPNKENTKNLGKNIFISQHSLLSARYTFPSDIQKLRYPVYSENRRAPQNSHQPEILPLHCWQIFYHRAIFSSLEKENNPRGLNLANRVREEAIRNLIH